MNLAPANVGPFGEFVGMSGFGVGLPRQRVLPRNDEMGGPCLAGRRDSGIRSAW
jgi:hypothetical protein